MSCFKPLLLATALATLAKIPTKISWLTGQGCPYDSVPFPEYSYIDLQPPGS
ncbi:hypothetical protein D3C78_957840 [compost metagenome]|jgi:hypothetical protein